jgi:hypothetical protein
MHNLVGQQLLNAIVGVFLFYLMKTSMPNEAQDCAYTSFNNIERLHSIEKANICE